MTENQTFLDRYAVDWRKNLDLVIHTMREMSSETEPQAMVRAFSNNIKQLRRHQWTNRVQLSIIPYRLWLYFQIVAACDGHC